jgi:isopenicillin N synthase-like dioxygenase
MKRFMHSAAEVALNVPVIDVERLSSQSLAERQAVAVELGAACRTIGFFYAVGHGISDESLRAVFGAAKQFFDLKAAQKRALSFRNSAHYHGYVELMGEQLDPDSPADMKESFGIGLELAPDDPRIHDPFRGANQWPQLPNWRDIVLRHFQACWDLGRRLHQGFSLDLGLDEMFFETKLDEPLAGLRLLHYPPASGLGLPDDRPGAGEHTDYGNVTILAVDGVGGLQLQTRDGTWIDAPSIDGALICNIGDCLMRWTNDVYVSTPHRVSIPQTDRYSIAFFLDPNPDALVIPVLGGDDAKRRYPPITGAEYLRSRLEATYVQPGT